MFDLINFLKYIFGFFLGFIVGFLLKCYMTEKSKEKPIKDIKKTVDVINNDSTKDFKPKEANANDNPIEKVK